MYFQEVRVYIITLNVYADIHTESYLDDEGECTERERSTLSHTPDQLQVLLTMMGVLRHWRVRVVPPSVSGQKRSPVVSALHSAHVCVCVCVKKDT